MKKFSYKLIYAPLAGCSDFPFRKMSARYKPDLMFCEMVKMEALLRKIPATYQMLEISDDMHPIGGQICGSDPSLAAPAAKIIEELGFDVVDFNCGCPVDKVTKDGSGSGMLKTPEKIGEMIANMVAAVKIPVTVKIRAGWDQSSINAPLVTSIAEKAGAQAVFVHGRTRHQGYTGPANWDYIKACKEVASSIQVIGNGDLFTPEAALKMFDYTSCDGILVSRGTMGQPWIVDEIRKLLKGENYIPKTPQQHKEALLEHLSYSTRYKTEHAALIDMRKVCCWYLKNSPGARQLRSLASQASNLKEIEQLIDAFQPC